MEAAFCCKKKSYNQESPYHFSDTNTAT